MPPSFLISVAKFACKNKKIKNWVCFVSLNEYKAKKQHNQGFGNWSRRLQMFFKIILHLKKKKKIIHLIKP